MKTQNRTQAGEGKIGCVVSLLVLILLGAIIYKVGPPYYYRNQLESLADDLASRAGVMTTEVITKQLRGKASEFELQEALQPGAINVSRSGTRSDGTCTIRLNWTQKIDLYGVTSVDLVTDKTVSKPYMDVR